MANKGQKTFRPHGSGQVLAIVPPLLSGVAPAAPPQSTPQAAPAEKCDPMVPLTLARLRAVNVDRCEKHFHPVKDWTATEWGVALAGEVGEVCHAVKKWRRMAGPKYQKSEDRDQKSAEAEMGAELADVVIYADLFAAATETDLAVVLLMRYGSPPETLTFDQVCAWMRPFFRSKRDVPCDLASALASHCGQVLAYGDSEWAGAQRASKLAELIMTVGMLANRFGLSLGDEIVRKFDRVSERVGYAQKLMKTKGE